MKKGKLDSILTLVILCFLFGYLVFKILYRATRNRLLKNEGVYLKAIIIDKKNYMGNSPVSHEYSYSYRFSVDGKIYEGNSQDDNLRIGDTIEIVYVKGKPYMNKPVHPKD